MIHDADCKGCDRVPTTRLAAGEAERLLANYLAAYPGTRLADDATTAARLAACETCPSLQYGGTTCRHCGCLVAVRARLADKACPGSPRRW